MKELWLRGVDLNHRPLGYEPNELPDCSTPQFDNPKSSFRTLVTINGNRDWTVRNGETIFAMTGHPLDFHPRDVPRLDP